MSLPEFVEPLTHLDIVRALLTELEEREWVEGRVPDGHQGGGYQYRDVILCTTCEAEQEDPPKHKLRCSMEAALKQARAFVAAEEELEKIGVSEAL